MSRLAQWMMRLYPARWRRRYGDELDALLDDTGADLHVLADLMKGAIRMQFSTWSFAKLAVTFGLAGTLAGVIISLLLPVRYVARVELELSGADLPMVTVQTLETNVMSRSSLARVIQDPTLGLYPDQLKKLPLDDVIKEMRADVGFSLEGANRIEMRFSYPDRSKAQRTARIMAQEAARQLSRIAANGSQTPPIHGLQVLDTASLPTQALRPSLWLTATGGLLTGLFIGFLRRRTAVKLALFGTFAGIAVWWLLPSVSELLPDGTPLLHYESRATMYAERVPPAFLDSLLTQASSRTSLAALIADPRLRLYTTERQSRSLEEVAETMRRDVTFSTRDGGTGGCYIDISFKYDDRLKSQATVNSIISRIDMEYAVWRQRNPAPQWQTSWGKIAIVNGAADGSAVNVDRVSTNRATPVLSGLFGGLILGVAIALVRRRWVPQESAEPPAPRVVRPLAFDAPRFRRFALWLTVAGSVAGAVAAFYMPARYVSDALISFDNSSPDRAAILINNALNRGWSGIVIARGLYGAKPGDSTANPDFAAILRRARRDLTWRQVETGGKKTNAFRIQFTSGEPGVAWSVVQDAVGEIDTSLMNLHGGDDNPFDGIRGLDGALLAARTSSDGQPFWSGPENGFSLAPIPDAKVSPPASPVHDDSPNTVLAPAAESRVDVTIPFDDERAKPVGQSEYRAVRLNVIDPPGQPSHSEGPGWWTVAIGAAAGLALAALIGLIGIPGRRFKAMNPAAVTGPLSPL